MMGFDIDRVKWNKRRNKKNDLKDNRLSVCSECGWGIFKDQDYTWTSEGFKHTACILAKAS